MTQQAIFELLLQNNSFTNDNRNHIYPTLIPEAVENISTKLTDMLYDSLKVKSSASASRRTNILKFLQNIISHSHCHHHITEDNYLCVLKHLDGTYKKNDEIEEFLHNCQQEVNKNKLKLYEKITNELIVRNLKQKELNMQREFRANRIQTILSSYGIVSDVPHSETTYQHNEVIIKKIFGIDENVKSISIDDDNIQNKRMSMDYRLKQIKLGYAINNIGRNLEVEKYIDIIVHNLSSYEELYDFEKSFVKYIFNDIGRIAKYSSYNKFFFILEIDIIEMCTEIVQLDDSSEVQQLFQGLLENKKFIYLKSICNKDKYLSTKIKNIFYNLYGHSFCNVNIMKLMKLLV
ncbi:hypothetical protein WA026_002777 [Henosepilachna vigintioctopunctata]|uniref:Uncharacterized protein n=1 Tax=Henosepilachna vigintioctopunctata TaxID=420089 RepID=A0AAW1TSG1_9CUCU